MRTINRRRAGVVSAALAALAIAACGDDENGGGAGGSAGGQGGSAGQGPVHVHGLGINPKDGSLFIATHTGLFRAAPGESRASRVGDSTQDTMGFTVAGDDRFLGSGHPGEFENAVNPLGLIRSSDAGRSWETVSLSGEADFHVLRWADGTVYGVDSASGRLMVSGDSGESWQQRSPPAPLLDLAPHPRDPQRLVASGEGGLYSSGDGGRGWRPLGGEIGFLAWPSAGRLFQVNAAGTVTMSADAGRSWRPVGEIGGQPAAFAARTDRELYAALPDGTVKQSRDGGRSWRVRSTP
jgi:photosystem II stability/assembly factor-like uncharacterized protein